MNTKSPTLIRSRTEMAKKIIKHHFGTVPKKISYKNAGMTNSVFEIKSSAGNYIVRIGEDKNKLQDFIKEQWVTQRAKEAGVPVADILQVGCDLVANPYMLQQKAAGDIALHHPKRTDILHQLGSCTKLIHTIHTNGYGQ